MSMLAPTLQAFFTDQLVRQRNASPHTIAAYRDTIKLLLAFAAERTASSHPGCTSMSWTRRGRDSNPQPSGYELCGGGCAQVYLAWLSQVGSRRFAQLRSNWYENWYETKMMRNCPRPLAAAVGGI